MMSLMLSDIILQPRCVLQIFSPLYTVIKPFEPYIQYQKWKINKNDLV